MKKLFFLTLTLVSFVLISCDSDKLEQETAIETFDNSIAIIQHGKNIASRTESGQEALIIEIKNFSTNFVLKSEYYIQGIQYTDNGKFNDEIAGDGLYTSIQNYTSNELVSKSDLVNLGQDFKFNDELKLYLRANYSNSARTAEGGGKIKLGCKVKTVTCPETSWWNSCWPLSSPCTCVEFYDCEASIEISL